MKTVLSIYENLSMGGIPAVMRQRARSRGHRVRSILYFQNDRGGAVAFQGISNITLHVGIRNHAANVEDIISEYSPDVIYLYSHYHLAPLLASRCSNLVLEYHRSDLASVQQLGRFARHAAALNVPTEWSKRYVESHVPQEALDRLPIQVVPNLVDHIDEEEGDVVPLENGMHVLWVGQFGEHKNLADALGVFSGLSRRLPKARLHVVLSREWTKDTVRTALNQAAHLGVFDQVRLYNDLEPRRMAGLIRAIARSGGVNLVTSKRESYGLSIAEGRAYGLPSVSAAVGAIPEHVSDGVSGLLFRFGDVATATEKVFVALTDSKLRRILAAGMAAQHEQDLAVAASADRFA